MAWQRYTRGHNTDLFERTKIMSPEDALVRPHCRSRKNTYFFEPYHVNISKVIFIDGVKPLPYSSKV
jgi:hypothetical protein